MHVLGAPPAFVLSQDQTLSFVLASTGFKGRPSGQPKEPTRRDPPEDAHRDGLAAARTSPRNNNQPTMAKNIRDDGGALCAKRPTATQPSITGARPNTAGQLMWVRPNDRQASRAPFPARRHCRFFLDVDPSSDRRSFGVGWPSVKEGIGLAGSRRGQAALGTRASRDDGSDRGWRGRVRRATVLAEAARERGGGVKPTGRPSWRSIIPATSLTTASPRGSTGRARQAARCWWRRTSSSLEASL